MASPIPTDEARRRSLPGSDVFRRTHLFYRDELHRDDGVVALNVEALQIFRDSFVIASHQQRAEEGAAVNAWFESGGFASSEPMPRWPATIRLAQHFNYENLKIASAFELHLKGRLLAREFVVHDIDPISPEHEALRRDQRKRPIGTKELHVLKSYHFDGKLNYLPGIKDKSLDFSWITQKAEYRSALGLAAQQIDIIDDYRMMRNQIHLPGDFHEPSRIRAYPGPIEKFLIDFINSEVVDATNELIARHRLNYDQLPRLV